jgi:Zn-dependent peptidase ImmA (M78 family)
MDYSQFKISPLSNKEIREAADRIRVKFWGENIPVDIEHILEIDLKISIIPLPGLQNQISFDSFISSDWSNVYVDNDKYMSDSGYRRVRFSLAHELGHFVLHREVFGDLKIKSWEDYYRFYLEAPDDQYRFLEDQANKFAGYFLIPHEAMEQYREKLLVKARKLLVGTALENKEVDLTGVIAGEMAEIFNVSAQAMEIGLKS